jgi:hypothetical protein
MDDFAIRAPIDQAVVHVLDTMNSSSPSSVVPSLLVDQFKAPLVFIECPDANSSDELVCSDGSPNAPDDELDSLPRCDDGPAEIVDLYLAEIPLKIGLMSYVIEDQQVFSFRSRGSVLPGIDRIRARVPVATVLHRVIETCCAGFWLITKTRSILRFRRMFMQSLLESRILFSRFLLLYRVYIQIRSPEPFSQSHMIDEVVGLSVINPG